MIKACVVFLWLFSKIAWCAQVTVTPDARRTAVLRRGIENALIGEIPVGGHVQPSSGTGDNLLWKKAQKNAKKNRTSDEINRAIPHRRPFVTLEVWCPMKVLSRITSRHQRIIVITTTRSAIIRQLIFFK
jgi:hypothetical protein